MSFELSVNEDSAHVLSYLTVVCLLLSFVLLNA